MAMNCTPAANKAHWWKDLRRGCDKESMAEGWGEGKGGLKIRGKRRKSIKKKGKEGGVGGGGREIQRGNRNQHRTYGL